jgi:two-component system response regulator CpxR
MHRVLITDDDIELAAMLAEYLSQEGFEPDVAHDGETALLKATDNDYDIIILDIMMPKMNGFDVLRHLRNQSQVPVIMLTARGEDVDSIIGLEIGADDYLAKPCNPRVLVAHMRAILRRSETSTGSDTENIQIGALELQRGTRQILLGERALSITSTEFNILEVLMDNAGKVVTKNQLSERALGREWSPYDRSLDMHISKLRKKLAINPDEQEHIKTIRNVGYQFVMPAHE